MAVPKTAFLVTAHDQPLIARRLLDRLDVPWARTFVHVDRKVDIRPFRAGYSGGATFLPDSRRVPVYWGGFSIAQAMLNMIEYALEEMPDVERVVTLSGVDYPIRPLCGDRPVLRPPPRRRVHAGRPRREPASDPDPRLVHPAPVPRRQLLLQSQELARPRPRGLGAGRRADVPADLYPGAADLSRRLLVEPLPAGARRPRRLFPGAPGPSRPGSARPARRSSSSSRPASRQRRAPAASPRT